MVAAPGKYTAAACLAALLALALSAGAAAAPLELSDARGSFDLGRHLYVLEDPSGSLSAGEILARGGLKLFERNRSATFNRGYSDSAWWLGFSLKNGSRVHDRWYLELAFPTMDYFEVYRVDGGAVRLVAREGDSFPFSHRRIDVGNYVIPLSLDHGSEADFLVRIKTTSEVIVPLTVWSLDAYTAHAGGQYGALWFYFGIMAAMVIYNLFLFFSIRDTNYLYYVLYILFTTLSNMSFNGIAYQVLWPAFPYFNSISIVLMGNLALASFTQFSRKFLMMERYAPRYDRVMRAYIFLVLAFAAAIPFASLSFSIISLNTLVLVTSVLSLAAFGISVKKGYRPALLYILAMTFVFLGVILISLRNFGMLPDLFITRYGFHVGTSLEAVLLSFALGYRFNLLKAENQKLLLVNKDMEIARTIYKSILTTRIPKVRGVTIEACVMPMDQIGGDFLEFMAPRDGALGLFLADVSGHGVPASIGAAMLKVAVADNQHLVESTAELMRGVEQILAGRMGRQFFTATCAFIDTDAGVLRTSNAGHFSTLLAGSGTGEIAMLKPRGRAIGPFASEGFDVCEVAIHPGDRVVFYTDGVIECMNSAGEIFGEERVIDLVETLRDGTAAQLKDGIMDALRRWMEPATAFNDDCTLVVLEITEAGS